MPAPDRPRHAASFAMRRAWELLPTPNAHPSQGERDESETQSPCGVAVLSALLVVRWVRNSTWSTLQF